MGESSGGAVRTGGRELRARSNGATRELFAKRGRKAILAGVQPTVFTVGEHAAIAGEMEPGRRVGSYPMATHALRASLLRSRSAACVVVRAPTYDDACLAIEEVRASNRWVPIGIDCARHEWPDVRGQAEDVWLLGAGRTPVRDLVEGACEFLHVLHGAIERYAARRLLSPALAEPVWRTATGIFHDELADALGIKPGTKDKAMRDLRARTRTHVIDDMVRIAKREAGVPERAVPTSFSPVYPDVRGQR